MPHHEALRSLRVAFKKDVSPPNSMRQRGYKYDSPEKLIASIQEDQDLIIPEFATLFEGTKLSREEVRRRVADWLYEVSLIKEFASDPISVFCLAIELFDKILLSLEKVDVKWVQLLGIVCLWIAGKLHLDNFEIIVDANTIAEFTDYAYSKSDVLTTENLILKRVGWCVSSKYTVPWFVDYFGGFDTKKKLLLFDKIASCHISGRYREEDPYTCAKRLLE